MRREERLLSAECGIGLCSKSFLNGMRPAGYS
jgi:hypothetical protein